MDTTSAAATTTTTTSSSSTSTTTCSSTSSTSSTHRRRRRHRRSVTPQTTDEEPTDHGLQVGSEWLGSGRERARDTLMGEVVAQRARPKRVEPVVHTPDVSTFRPEEA